MVLQTAASGAVREHEEVADSRRWSWGSALHGHGVSSTHLVVEALSRVSMHRDTLRERTHRSPVACQTWRQHGSARRCTVRT